MKKLIITVAALVTTLCSFGQQKIGFLNSTEIIETMPEYKTMNEALEKKKAEYSKLMESMYSEYEKKSKDLQAAGTTMAQAMQELKMQEIKDLENRMNAFQKKAQSDLANYAQQYSKPLQSKFQSAVKDVAKEQAYSYILDLASNAVPYYPEGSSSDVSALVRTKLGITGGSAPKPATPAAKPGSPAPSKK